MPIDYSKWDKIELSDDSDIEVHPNVDKKSFIKWKQRDIHEKRIMRNQEIKALTIQTDMYIQLNRRVDYLLDHMDDSELIQEPLRISKLDANFDKNEKFDPKKLPDDIKLDPSESDNTPPYNEMIEDLFTQVAEDMVKDKQDPRNAPLLRLLVLNHRAKIDGVLDTQQEKLKELYKEKSLHISSEDMHMGFDKSFLNKNESAPIQPPEEAKAALNKTAQKSPESAVEKLSSPVSSVSAAAKAPSIPSTSTVVAPSAAITTPAPSVSSSTSAPLEQEDIDSLFKDTEKFGTLSPKDLTASARFLEEHYWIVSENQKDALIMKAFDFQLEGNAVEAKKIVHQSLLIQYVAQLAQPNGKSGNVLRSSIQKGVDMFFGKIVNKDHPASKGFLQDVDFTYNHIATRCEVIKQEHQEQSVDGEEQIQLRSLDADSELVVVLPESDSSDPEEQARYQAFLTLPAEMQAALKTESLDEINKVFATMPVEEAEQILEIFEESQVIGVQALLENEDEFAELQKQFNSEEQHDGGFLEDLGELDIDSEVIKKEPDFISTADIVD